MVNSTTTAITGDTHGAFPDGVDSPGVVSLTASTTISKGTHKDRILTLDGTGAAYTQTLPSATGSGDKYTFAVGAVNTSNHVITTQTADKFYGNIITNSTGDTPDLGQPWPAGATDTITLNGTTTGGQAVGDIIEVIDIATNKWLVTGVTTSSGTEATPFS